MSLYGPTAFPAGVPISSLNDQERKLCEEFPVGTRVESIQPMLAFGQRGTVLTHSRLSIWVTVDGWKFPECEVRFVREQLRKLNLLELMAEETVKPDPPKGRNPRTRRERLKKKNRTC